MGRFVLVLTEDNGKYKAGCYGARSGHPSAYTRQLEHAKIFTSREQAERECCENEAARSLDAVLSHDAPSTTQSASLPVASPIAAALEVLVDHQCGLSVSYAIDLARTRHRLSEAQWGEIAERVENASATRRFG